VRTKDTAEKAMRKLQNNSIIDELTGCWLYQGVPYSNGYCHIMFSGKRVGIHRLSAHAHWNFDLDSEMSILHALQCPNKHCWNPAHLYIGTQGDNVRDAITLGNHVGSHDVCKLGHLLDGFNNQGKRFCITCHKETNLKSYHRKDND
jgi:hypothetical protein